MKASSAPNSTILGNQVSPLSLPVLTMPPLQAIMPGATDVSSRPIKP
jgi:hypothetical protein